MSIFADLHTHTRFSDGTDDPKDVVERVRRAGLGVMAITDHDNIEALPIAAPVAQAAGIELIPGIEMSASCENVEVHILGYYFDVAHAGFLKHLSEQQARRVARVHETVKRLAKVGVFISAEEILALAGEGTVGRPHVARILLKRGYISSVAEAFDRFIGPEGPGFVPGSVVDPAVIIDLIRQAGGIPSLAHPIYLKNDAMIDRFAADGLMGLEVYHSSHTGEQIKRYEAVADRLKLIRTGGSDYHGEANKEGAIIGSCRLDARFVDDLKSVRATARRA